MSQTSFKSLETLHCVELSGIPIYEQLQWEEALLRVDTRNWCLLNRGSPPAIVMGISGQKHLLIQENKFQEAPLPLIRRFSGGGTVVVDENTLFVTLICQTAAVPIPPFPRPLMEWTSKLYRPLFSQSFEMKENDYTINGRKWGGNAQSITKGRWLHHSSLLWDFNSNYMDYLTLPAKMPSYRQARPHTEFLCRLRDYWEHEECFYTKFVRELGNHFIVHKENPDILREIALKPHRKATCLLE